jgi:hypothetical protein
MHVEYHWSSQNHNAGKVEIWMVPLHQLINKVFALFSGNLYTDNNNRIAREWLQANDMINTKQKLTGISGSNLYARARTREPCRVYFLYVSTYAAGKSTNLSWMVSGAP